MVWTPEQAGAFPVDLAGRTATITQQLTTVGYRPVIKIVKSYAGDRIIALDASTTTALRIYQERRERAGGPTPPG
jgi:uncharacterized protein (DUF849 family)